jgi:hypothetical protein
VRWYLGANGCEVFAWLHPGKPAHHVQLVFARVSVEWSQREGLKTGTFQETSSTAGGRYDPYLLTHGKVIDPEVVRAALVLLKGSQIDPAVGAPLVTALERAAPEP